MRSRVVSHGFLIASCVTSVVALTSEVTARDRNAMRAFATVPLPPPRPAEYGGVREAALSRGVPDVPAPVPVPAVAVATLPRSLPPASRERMHACGLEWQQIKWSGSAGERTWRDFAMTCLPR